ncbi:MAG TPA: Rrf2 family transcriptional regulator [Gaiellaceae bacterium]|jgi:Rrf2 family protein|nr:Rrf2 family transcriptional regulator [Gaiellaceae bacterium]
MRVSAKADYAIRAMVELAAAGEGPLKADRISQAQEIPIKFLENIMSDLRNSGLVRSQRGIDGGYWLARPAAEISLAQVMRAVDGPLANVRGLPPEDVSYSGIAEPLRDVWIGVRASLRRVLEAVTLADVARGELPADVVALTADDDAWQPR